jgi:agmatine deiminase
VLRVTFVRFALPKCIARLAVAGLCEAAWVSGAQQGTPLADGFAMPAEWGPHSGCWMVWPQRTDTWRLGAGPAQAAFARVAREIAAFEPLTMLVSAGQWQHARAVLPAHVRVVEMTTDDAWARDTGPTFVTEPGGRTRGVDWRFNAWGGLDGGLFFPWDADDAVARKVCDLVGLDSYRAPFVLEGGAVHVDGEGTVLTTEQCLLNPNRNPHLDRAGIEQALCSYLGARTVIWLGEGVVDDETDGHVDNLAFFVRPGVVALSWCDDPADPMHAVSVDALARLEAATDARGRSLEVVKLPMPGPLFMTAEEADGVDIGSTVEGTGMNRVAGQRLAGSYANLYLANGGAIVPLLDAATDDAALAIVSRLYPLRRVVGVPAREILLGGGNIHCITQQQPIGTRG